MDVDEIKFNALRNAHYHRARMGVLDSLNKIFNFVVIMLGASVAGDLLNIAQNHERATYLGLATTFVATIQLVFDPGGRARTHEFLQRRFYEILASLEEVVTPTEEQLRLWDASLTRIYADQPPTLRALDSIAYNETSDALGMDRNDRLRITLLQSTLRHIFAFNSSFFPTIGEWRADHPKGKVGHFLSAV